MDSTETQSLSRGVFAFRGKRRKPSPRDFFESDCGLRAKQLEHYNYLSFELDRISETIHSEISNDLFTNLTTYITDCGLKRSTDEIHAAAIVTGVNTPDHDVLYSNVVSQIKEKVTPHVALLQSKSKATSLKLIIQQIASQLSSCEGGNGDIAQLSSQTTLFHIEKWYTRVESGITSSSPRKGGRKRQSSQPFSLRPVVLVFEEFGSFPMKCMQDLLISCRNHLDQMPIVLVFGVSLSLAALRSTLTHELSTMLSIEAFQMTSSSVYLNTLIDKMLINSPLPFRLGGRTFQMLLDNFLCHDFSIQKFLCSMKFCLMNHCLGGSQAMSSLSQNSLSKLDLDVVRRLMSYRRFVEGETDPSIQIKLLEDNTYTRSTISSLIDNINIYHKKQPYILACLHCLVKDIPGTAFGKQMREVYYSVLSDGMLDSLKQHFELLRNLSRVELQRHLQFIADTMSSCPVSVDVSALSDVLYKLDHFDELLAEAEEESLKAEKKSLLDKKMNMYTLRKTLQGHRPRHVTLYEDIRSQAIDALQQFFGCELKHFKDLPLHELFYYDNAKTLKAAINAMPRVAIFSALNKPNIYIDAVGELPSTESVTPRLPDTSLAFKLHLECGSMINVYDWMQAFIAVHETGSSSSADTKQLCARFTHSAAEMQLLGFVKSTKRKTDHMTRLTWGTV